MKKINIVFICFVSYLNGFSQNFSSKEPIPIGKFGNSISDVDGNIYKTVIIGKQEWMAENLKVTKYNDKKVIPNVKDDKKWYVSLGGAWCYYENDSLNNSKYGKLYNWYAVSKYTNGGRNVCPSDWHVPSNDDWSNLIKFLGGEQNAGGKLKEVDSMSWAGKPIQSSPDQTIWISSSNSSTNTSLFTALPGGKGDGKYFNSLGLYGYWWSSTATIDLNSTYFIYLNSDVNEVYKQLEKNKYEGLSVRCIKD
jgi:uncharacterized protein (TIGR02145 family)